MGYLPCLLFGCLHLLTISLAQENPCIGAESQVSCDACISASYLCSWCPYFPNVTTREQRCQMRTSSDECPSGTPTEDPQPAFISSINKPLSVTASADSVQVAPQNITFSLRKGRTESFRMTFRSLRNAPLDIYFLVDLSSSLAQVVSILRRDLDAVANSLIDISTAFQMGFGSFVDKSILPFALSNYMFRNADDLPVCSFESCVPTYSFRNSQPLTANVSEISESVSNSAPLSSNLDPPEGGLDALLQVAACTSEIGWRQNALHMVFLITDQGYHAAGDGRVAGILTRNDGLCHLEDGEYTHGLLQDYPSLPQMRQLLETNLIVPVFSLRFDNRSSTALGRLTDSLEPTYGRLVEELRSTQAQVISFQASSVDEIIRVIQESYEATIQSIRVNVPNVPGYSISITPVQGCDNINDDGSCRLQFDEEVTFDVNVTLTDCTMAGTETKRVNLLGPPFSFTTLDLVPICQCPCSIPEPEVNSTLCSSRGSLQCGLCDCMGLFFGEQCECTESVSDCASSSLSGVCSEMGVCTSCGICKCFNGTFGSACQCSDSDCLGGCSGNGQCECGDIGSIPTCNCDIAPISGLPFFQGNTPCQCNPDNCFNPNFPGELCHNSVTNSNGREFCLCSGCVCQGENLQPTVDNRCADLCMERENCFRCRIGDTFERDCPSSCAITDITALENDEIPESTINSRVTQCPYSFENCFYTLYIEAVEGSEVLGFTSNCGTPPLPWIIAGSLVGAIILLGCLFLFILKLCLVFWDRIEYRKFTQELKDAEFAPHQNPLYVTPQQDYENPLRARRAQQQEQPPQGPQ